MVKKASKSDLILVLSLLGMLSVLVTIISDFILIGKPSTAYSFLKLGTESMWDIEPWKITAGAFVGVVALPFQVLGLIPVYFALKPSGKVLPVMAVIANAHMLLMGVAFHISYAYIGTGWIIYHKNELTNQITTEIVDKFASYWMILVIIMFVELLFGSIIYVIVVLKGKTLFPRWMAIFNPLCIVLYTFPIVFILPSPIGGYIAPAYLNLSTLLFFTITLVVLYKKMKKIESEKEIKGSIIG
ncbi:MAG: DUF6796 family protein [Mobilitalea sp.]